MSELVNDKNYLSSNDTIKVQEIEQDEYNNLAVKDPNVLYIICTQFLIWGTASWGVGTWGLQDAETN